ncbi:2-phospho-L-lactate guanylyltransferase [Microbacterium sp. C7(2022)]|uniref:2-phospho-L-lactate guanylyltransferase n=1 Tax=Microbacterium sp. C7(2022) TaxID=2992759 RepID=UPI00237B42FD|nr:2-phospho-L-lactate guanylyltransferase [Microbacterium sp. C7(2022)]MDE0546546.1 2-phospho-L-lactate guanylyltransferase [Microbacterium sp. C7(2022)]
MSAVPGADAGDAGSGNEAAGRGPGDAAAGAGTGAGAGAGGADAGADAGAGAGAGAGGAGAGAGAGAGDPSEVLGWALVIPVKAPTRGKSRLDVPGVDRVSLARAIALDTIAAAAACDQVERVIVVTDDPQLPLHAFDIPGLGFVDESDAGGLNEAITLGVATARRAEGARRCAVLLADVPALRPADLSVALRAAASVDRGVVADADGTGSTLVTAGRGIEWRSAFGDDSFARHVSSGCTPLAVPAESTLRRDVDTAEHLTDAARLGLGPRTARIFASASPT